MDSKPPKKFGDFAREAKPLDGAKVKIEDILNKEMTVIDYKIRDSKYDKKGSPKCLTLQFEMDKQKYILFTGSNVLVDQMEKYKHEIPFITVIKKIDKYYTFT